MRKIVVTGMSIISPLGLDLEQTWNALIEGRSGISEITRFDASALGSGIAGQVPDGLDSLEGRYIQKRSMKQMTRLTRMSVIAGRMAAENAGIGPGTVNPDRFGITFGATGTGYRLDEQQGDLREAQGFRILKSMPSAAPAFLSIALSARGPGFTVSTACSSSALAISSGIDLIRAGRADVVLAGGGDSSISPEDVRGFIEIMALSTRRCPPSEACCPFDRRRDGFVMSEGAAFLVLEEIEHARARGAGILAEAAGSSVLSEGYNILSPEKGGEGMARAMASALSDAAMNPSGIDYVNAHGTSTPLNDPMETAAIKRVFGDRARGVLASSTKSMTGHMLAAAGAVEAAITVMTIVRGVVPPTINLFEPDPECDLDYVPNSARKARIRSAISNSFAFGGHNVVLVFRAV